MKQANEKTEKISDIWRQQQPFHHFMQDVIVLHTYQNNIGKVVEQLTYFIDMDFQMQKLQKMAEDQSKYLIVANKLLNLIQLRDALLDDSSWQKQTAIMRKQFVKVDNFEITFFDKIFLKFADCIKEAQQNPQGLRMAVQAIESFDNSLEASGKQSILRSRAITRIEQSIQAQFIQHLQNKDELIDVIQNSKFATQDIINVSDYVEPLFPKSFPIVQIYLKAYQQKIESFIIPFFDQINEQQQYGHLIILLGWIDQYETMLTRAGIDSVSLTTLKSKVKIMMPYFIDHNRKIVEDYVYGCIEEDRKNYGRKFYEDKMRDGDDLISMFPSDIFRFINQEAQVIKDQLKGQIFIEFVRCITQTINFLQKNLTKQVQEEWKQVKNGKDDEIVLFQYKVVMFINNYNQCLKHAGQSKELFSQYVTEEYRTRIEKIFLLQVQKEFNYSIPKFITLINEIIFLNILKEYYTQLFTHKWINDKSGQVMSNILKVVASEIADIENQNLIINIIHYRMVVKQTLELLVNAYIQQFIIFVKIIYKAHAHMEVKYCNKEATIKRMMEASNVDYKVVFNSKVAFTEAVKKDKNNFIKFSQNFSQCTSKTFMGKLQAKFMMLNDLLIKKGKEFDVLPIKVSEVFPEKASELLEAVLIARDDIQNRAALLPKRGMGAEI